MAYLGCSRGAVAERDGMGFLPIIAALAPALIGGATTLLGAKSAKKDEEAAQKAAEKKRQQEIKLAKAQAAAQQVQDARNSRNLKIGLVVGGVAALGLAFWVLRKRPRSR